MQIQESWQVGIWQILQWNHNNEKRGWKRGIDKISIMCLNCPFQSIRAPLL